MANSTQQYPELKPEEERLARKFAQKWQSKTAKDFFDRNPKIGKLLDQLLEGADNNNEINPELATEFYRELKGLANNGQKDPDLEESQPKKDPHRFKKQFAQDLGAFGATVGACFIPGFGIGIAASIASNYIAYRLQKSEKKQDPIGGVEEDLQDANERLDWAGDHIERAAKAGLAVAGAVTGMSTVTAVVSAAITVGKAAVDAVYDSEPQPESQKDDGSKNNNPSPPKEGQGGTSWTARMSVRRSESINSQEVKGH